MTSPSSDSGMSAPIPNRDHGAGRPRRRGVRAAVTVAAVLLLIIIVALAVNEMRIRRDAALARAEAPTDADLKALIAAHRPGAPIVARPRGIEMIESSGARVQSIVSAYEAAASRGDRNVHNGFSLLIAGEPLPEHGSAERSSQEAEIAAAREVLAQLEAAEVFAGLMTINSVPTEVRDLGHPIQAIGAMPEYPRVARQLARALGARAIVAIERGDVETARESLEAVRAVARICAEQPMLIEWLVSAAIDALALGVARQWLASEPTREELDAIEAVCFGPRSPPTSELAIRVDGLLSQAMLAKAIEDIGVMRPAALIGAFIPDLNEQLRSPGDWRTNRDAIAAMTEHLSAAQRLEPYQRSDPAKLPPLPHFEGAGFAAVVFAWATEFPKARDVGLPERRADAVAIALERWRLAHGAYPESMDVLVPDLLPSVPIDPWWGHPLAYRRLERVDELGRSYLIYLRGPDGTDDGGRESPPDSMGSSRGIYEPPRGFDAPLNRSRPIRRESPAVERR